MRKLIHEEILTQRLTEEEALATTRHRIIGILENIRSAYNVGSCFRTADAMLLEQLYLTGYTPCPPKKEVLKTALGSTNSVPWQHSARTSDVITELKSQGYTVLALELTENSIPLQSLASRDIIEPIALIVGNELSGISQETLDMCDAALEIPMHGVKHSLNVAVAFGIGMWELVHQFALNKAPTAE